MDGILTGRVLIWKWFVSEYEAFGRTDSLELLVKAQGVKRLKLKRC